MNRRSDDAMPGAARAVVALPAALLLGAAAALLAVVQQRLVGTALGQASMPRRLLLACLASACLGLWLGALLAAAARPRARLLPGLMVALSAACLLLGWWPPALLLPGERQLWSVLPPLAGLCTAIGALARSQPRLRLPILGLCLFGSGLTLHLGNWPLLATDTAVLLLAAALLAAAALLWWLPPAEPRAFSEPPRGAVAAGFAGGGLLVAAAGTLPAAAVAAGLPPWSPPGLLLVGLAVGMAAAALWRALHRPMAVTAVTLLAAVVVAALHLLPPLPALPPQWVKCMPLAAGAGVGILLGAAASPAAPLFGLGAGIGLGGLAAAAVLSAAPLALLPLLPFAITLLALLPQLRASLLAWPVAAGLVVCLLLPPASEPAGALQPDRRSMLLARRGNAAAIYRRSDHELQQCSGGRVVDVAGPMRQHAALLAGLGQLLQPQARHVALLGLGTGRLLATWQQTGSSAAVDLVVHRADDVQLFGELQVDGPVPRPPPQLLLPPGTFAAPMGLRSWLRRQPQASVDLAMLAQPLGAEAPWLASAAFHTAARRALGPGVLLIAGYLDTAPVAQLQELLRVATAVHPHCAVLLVRNVVVLLASGRELDFAAAAAHFAQLPPDLQWSLHAAGCGSGCDLQLARLVDFAAPFADDPAADAGADRRRGNLELLQRATAAGAAGEVAADRLLRWLGSGAAQDLARQRLARRQRQLPEATLLADEALAEFKAAIANSVQRVDPSDASAVAQLAAAAASAGHLGCPSAELQAALSLQDRIGAQQLAPAAAMQRALAIDPTLPLAPPPLFAALLPAVPPPSPLEDFAVLPGGEQLAAWCSGDSARAVALRAVFPSACARALLQIRSQRPWQFDELAALRQLADAFVLARADALLAPLQASAELIGFWRRDLAMPTGLQRLLHGDAAARLRLAVALCGHDDCRTVAAVAMLLIDADGEVRSAAAAALFRLVGDRIDYDPQWPESRRREAAERLTAMRGDSQAGG